MNIVPPFFRKSHRSQALTDLKRHQRLVSWLLILQPLIIVYSSYLPHLTPTFYVVLEDNLIVPIENGTSFLLDTIPARHHESSVWVI